MSSVIKTSKNRILDLPVYISDMVIGEHIVGTNADGGCLYTGTDDKGTFLEDACKVIESQTQNCQFISLPLIEDLQIETEKEEWILAAKLRQVSDIEKEHYKSDL